MIATPLTGLVGVAVLLVLLLAGVRIGVALGLVGFAGLALAIGPEAAAIKSGVVVIETLSRYELGTLPLFLLMAQMFFATDASRDLFDAAARFTDGLMSCSPRRRSTTPATLGSSAALWSAASTAAAGGV